MTPTKTPTKTPANARSKEITAVPVQEFHDYGALRQALSASAARFPAFTDIVWAGLNAETRSGQAAADRPARRPQESARGKHSRRWDVNDPTGTTQELPHGDGWIIVGGVRRRGREV
jgi:hypothetical protein